MDGDTSWAIFNLSGPVFSAVPQNRYLPAHRAGVRTVRADGAGVCSARAQRTVGLWALPVKCKLRELYPYAHGSEVIYRGLGQLRQPDLESTGYLPLPETTGLAGR